MMWGLTNEDRKLLKQIATDTEFIRDVLRTIRDNQFTELGALRSLLASEKKVLDILVAQPIPVHPVVALKLTLGKVVSK